MPQLSYRTTLKSLSFNMVKSHRTKHLTKKLRTNITLSEFANLFILHLYAIPKEFFKLPIEKLNLCQ